MENNFNNETMVNNGVKAMDSRKLIHNAVDVYQTVSVVLITVSLGYHLVKYVGKKRKEAKASKRNIEVVKTEDIKTIEEK